MGELFLASRVGHGHLQQQVALKRMLPHLTRQKDLVSMFLDEARVASLLSHPNLVQVIDFGEVAGEYYLAMEYLPGETLSSVIHALAERGQQVPLQVALQILIAVCDGLHYAHEFAESGRPLGLVHRDVTPSNVMVTFHGGVKVLDFGIAYSAQRSAQDTQAGVVKGKLPYCSPEQVQGARLDRRSDVFSLGSLLSELLTGKPVFRRDSDFATSQAVVQELPPPLSSLRKDLPPELDLIVSRAMGKDPSARYPTCLEMRRAIEKLQGPAVRLDDYLAQLFGEARLASRVSPQTPIPPARLSHPSTPSNVSPRAPATVTSLLAAPKPAPAADSARATTPCPHTSTCALFPQFKLVSLLSVWKLSYCDANYAKCVRYQMSNQGKAVSLAMLPNGTLLTPPRKR